MADGVNAGQNFGGNNQFKTISSDKKTRILEEKDNRTIQKATKGAVYQFSAYLHVKSLPDITTILPLDLANALFNFYC